MTSKTTTTYPFYIMQKLRTPWDTREDKEIMQTYNKWDAFKICVDLEAGRIGVSDYALRIISDLGGRIVWPEDEVQAEDDVPFSFAEETCTCVHDCDNEPSFGMRWLTWYEGEAKGEEPTP